MDHDINNNMTATHDQDLETSGVPHRLAPSGAIVDRDNCIVYEAFCLKGLTRKARARLVELCDLGQWDWAVASSILG